MLALLQRFRQEIQQDTQQQIAQATLALSQQASQRPIALPSSSPAIALPATLGLVSQPPIHVSQMFGLASGGPNPAALALAATNATQTVTPTTHTTPTVSNPWASLLGTPIGNTSSTATMPTLESIIHLGMRHSQQYRDVSDFIKDLNKWLQDDIMVNYSGQREILKSASSYIDKVKEFANNVSLKQVVKYHKAAFEAAMSTPRLYDLVTMGPVFQLAYIEHILPHLNSQTRRSGRRSNNSNNNSSSSWLGSSPRKRKASSPEAPATSKPKKPLCPNHPNGSHSAKECRANKHKKQKSDKSDSDSE